MMISFGWSSVMVGALPSPVIYVAVGVAPVVDPAGRACRTI
jgi:hypothetical protein